MSSNLRELELLEAEAVRLARGPDLARTVPTEREQDFSLARERLFRLAKESGVSQTEFAEALLGVDESAVRGVKKGTSAIPVPWWLERLLRTRPELVASFAAGLLRDSRRALERKSANG